jgi:hypothetical protein
MADNREPHDRYWDELLRKTGPDLEWSSEPSPEQQARWKQPSDSRRSIRGPFRWVANSRALAAAILLAISAFLWVGAGPVSARVIMKDLRAALQRSMLLSLEGVEIDFSRLPYPHTNARVVFDGQIFAGDVDQHEAYLDLALDVFRDVEAGSSPIEFDVVASAVPSSEWGYVRLSELPRELLPKEVSWFMLAEIAQQGVYLNLAGLLEGGVEINNPGWPAFGLEDVLNLRDRRGVDELLAHLVEYAGQTEIEERPDGTFVLRASGFYETLTRAGRSEPLLQLAGELIRNVIVEVEYHRWNGVQRIRVDHFGHGDGTLVLELEEVHFDRAVLDRDSHAQRNSAPTIDLPLLKKMGEHLATAVSQGS